MQLPARRRRHLFARCATKLCYIIRQAPFGRATLRDAEVQIDFAPLTDRRDRVAVVATEPLTRDETWHEGKPGSLWIFERGALRATLPSGKGMDLIPGARVPAAPRTRRAA